MRFLTLAVVATVAGLFAGCAQHKPLRVEAEGAQLKGVTAATTQPTDAGPSGGAYVTNFRNEGDQIVFEADVPAGFYEVRIGYRSPSGPKGFMLKAGDMELGGMFDKTGEGFVVHRAGFVELPAGRNEITLKKGWGYYDVDYLELQKTNPPKPPVTPPVKLADPNATAPARALMAYLTDIYGRFTLSGVYSYEDAKYVQELTGKYPAIMGGDLMDYSPSRVERGTRPAGTVEKLIDEARAGSIITISWHWNAPAGLIDKELTDDRGNKFDARWYKGFNTNATTFDVAAALANPQSEEYRLLIRDIDVISAEMKKLADAGVPVLWRPLHEAEGKWFWWGAKGPEACNQLWRLMYERMTQHHQLHNLIWVWNSIDPAWYPGDDVVDIIGVDAYTAISDPLAGPWRNLQERLTGKKLLAITEFGKVPDVPRMHRYGAWWSYFVSWSGELGPKGMAKEEVQRIYRHPRVLNRELLPRFVKQPQQQ